MSYISKQHGSGASLSNDRKHRTQSGFEGGQMIFKSEGEYKTE